jgi:hypothetical protein
MTLALEMTGPIRSYSREVVDFDQARDLVARLEADEEWVLIDTAQPEDERRLASGRGPHWHEPGSPSVGGR